MTIGLAFYRDLYGPVSDPGGRYPMSGDDCLAVKRVLSRAGYLPWMKFTNVYGQDSEQACKQFQRDVGIRGQGGGEPKGHYGEKTHKALLEASRAGYDEDAWDDYSRKLYAEAIVPNTPPGLAFHRDLWGPGYDPYKRYPMSGDDCLAVKRALSRAGWIPWQQFTNVYGEQAEKGCAGFQASVGITGDGGGPPRGHYGQKTHNALLKAKREMKHEWAWDAHSLKIYKAYTPPSQGGKGSIRENALAEAVKYIGVKESPAGSNMNQFGAWYGMNGVPWCAIFVSYCYETGSKQGSQSFAKGSYYSYVPYVVSDARAGRRGLSVTSTPKPGDLCCYDWGRDGTFDHIGIFEAGTASSWNAIEGNTSTSNNSNGGQVMRRSRSSSDGSIVFVRVAA